MPRAPALYHFFPGRPYIESDEGTGEACPETYGPWRCKIRLAPAGLRRRKREVPVVARAWPVGCVCTDQAALVELTGPVAGVRLEDIVTTLELIEKRRKKSRIWLELRAVLLPGPSEAAAHIDQVAALIRQRLGPDVPVHVTTAGLRDGLERSGRLERARWAAAANGLRWVYTDDAMDPGCRCTWCPGCRALLLDHRGPVSRIVGIRASRCTECGLPIPGRFPHEAA